MNKNLLLLLTLIALLKAPHLYSQTITIDSARSLTTGFAANTSTGPTVTVGGIVTNGSELGSIRYIQDGTGALSVYGAALSTVNRGDSIQVTGTLTNYNSLVELDVTSVTVVSTANPLPAPIVFSASTISSAFSEAYEGQLVELVGVSSITTTGGATFTSFGGNTGYKINGVSADEIYIKAQSTGDTGIVGQSAPVGTFSIIGIMSQYSSSSASSGYELLPRLYNDFILSNAPNINSAITVTNITTTSLTINYTTLNSGDTKIVYGPNTASLNDTVYSSTATTNHSVTLTGLSPATVYYIKPTSTNSSGTSTTASYIVVITASQSTGDMTVYFNNTDANHGYAWPGNNATTLNGLIDDTLINYINRAKYSIDIAMYDWNNSGLSNMTAAVNAAYTNRGVHVRVIGDGSTGNSGIYSLNSGIGVIFSPTTSAYGIMHNKFMIIDGVSTDPNDPIVWTGSTNWTEEQINSDNNNVIIVQDQSLAKAYTMEFNQMFGSTGLLPNSSSSKFGPYKSDVTPHFFNIGGVAVQCYFSPSDGTTSKLINSINTTNHDFEFATMLITRTDIASALENKFTTLADTCSGGVVDDTANNSDGPNFLSIQSVLHNRMRTYITPYIMHSKYIVIDEGDTTSDPHVFSGSHNWSTDAETKNDENVLVIHNAKIANKYFQNFAAIFGYTGGVACNYYCPIVNAGADQTVCSTDTIHLGGTVLNATGGTWTSSGTGTFYPNSSALNASYIPSGNDISNGSVTLTLTSTGNGTLCSGSSDQVSITIGGACNTGITSAYAADAIVVYPNPTSTSFQLNVGNADVVSMELLDSKGTTVIATSADVTSAQNISGLSEGLYFVKIYMSDNSMTVKKLVIAR